MNKAFPASTIFKRLLKRYPMPRTALRFQNAWELLVATVLSAQCTDERVNKVTPVFFRRWPLVRDLAGADVGEVEEVVHSTGFFRQKAKNLVATAKLLIRDHEGLVPRSMDALVKLPGVARKTANIVLWGAYGINEGVAVDTHVKRISLRMGLSRAKAPDAVERDLMALFPKKDWGRLNNVLVLFGREVCKARKPRCPECDLKDLCPKIGVKE
ncbi:MAG: endonuclease III [Thermodesulfobacteriota bacterium]|nr:endonuclease III [Thermodesulfobacteriota bacterium]